MKRDDIIMGHLLGGNSKPLPMHIVPTRIFHQLLLDITFDIVP
jgi:hypothetical protein